MSNNVKIKCKDCGGEFIFSEAEQKFYEEKGFVPPKRCKSCRKIKNKLNNQERRKK